MVYDIICSLSSGHVLDRGKRKTKVGIGPVAMRGPMHLCACVSEEKRSSCASNKNKKLSIMKPGNSHFQNEQHGARLQGQDLSMLGFGRCCLKRADFRNCILSKCDFESAKMAS